MISKNDLQALMLCTEVAQTSGKVGVDAMIGVGVAYQNAKRALSDMHEGDMLIVFSPKKNEVQPGESGEQSQNQADLKPEKKGK